MRRKTLTAKQFENEAVRLIKSGATVAEMRLFYKFIRVVAAGAKRMRIVRKKKAENQFECPRCGKLIARNMQNPGRCRNTAACKRRLSKKAGGK